LQSFFQQATLDLSLIYKGSIHGFDLLNFHSLCGQLPRSVILVQSEKGRIFGGYADRRLNKTPTYIQGDGNICKC
jgi:hypothetical protein